MSRRPWKVALRAMLELGILPLLAAMALLSRARRGNRRFAVGLGPEPLINNVYHKRALALRGFPSETFVSDVYHITHEFDFRGDKRIRSPWLRFLFLFVRSLFRYRCLYIYFNGGPLGFTEILWRFEPALYRLAGIKIVVMPYGSDVNDLVRTPNLRFRHAMAVDYPRHRFREPRIRRKIDLWVRCADHVIAGCDWVDYLPFWHTLLLAHFSIDTAQWIPNPKPLPQGRPLRVLHAPNHRALKGTAALERAILRLRAEGYAIELTIASRRPNSEIRRLIEETDLVVDQLVIGWYAMFALEAMSLGRPAVCFLRPDLLELYLSAGLIEERPPLLQADELSIYEVLRGVCDNPRQLAPYAELGPRFVARHHSLERIGDEFRRINESLGVTAH